MARLRSTGIALAAAALCACAQQPPQVPPAPPPPMLVAVDCDSGAAQYAVGRAATAELSAEARARAGAQRLRVLRPGQVVTMEFDAGRLTLDVDAEGRVVKARCG